MSEPDRAAQAAEKIAEHCLSELGHDWREEVQPKELDELAAIIRPYLADAEARAQAAEAKLAEVRRECETYYVGFNVCASRVLAILNRKEVT
jgi:hypothetical protein